MDQAQVKKLEKNPEDKIQVLNSEKKLQELGRTLGGLFGIITPSPLHIGWYLMLHSLYKVDVV